MIPSLKSSENTAFCAVGVVKRPSGGIKGMAAGTDGRGREAPFGRQRGALAVSFLIAREGGLPRCFGHCIPLFACIRVYFRLPAFPCKIQPGTLPRFLTITPALYFCPNILQSHIFPYFYAFVFTNKYFSYKFNFSLLSEISLYHPQISLPMRISLYFSASPDPRARRMARCPAPAFATGRKRPRHSPYDAMPNPRVRHRAQAPTPDTRRMTRCPTPAFATGRKPRPRHSPYDAMPNPRVRHRAQAPTPTLAAWRDAQLPHSLHGATSMISSANCTLARNPNPRTHHRAQTG